MIGIYAIYRKSDDKCMYVGQSKEIERRLHEHLIKKSSKLFTYECYGKIIETFDIYDKENQLNREAYWIDVLKPELNIDRNRHHIWSNDARNKLSESLKGRDCYWCKNVHLSDEHKKKISESNKGKILSEEHKKNLSDSHKGKLVGYKHSDEARKNMSNAAKGRYKGKHWKLVDGKRVWY